MPARLFARVREGRIRQLKGTPMKAFHGSEAESEEIAFEMAQLLGELKAQDPERSRPRVRCPECGKEFGQEAFRAHRIVVHGR